MISSRFQAATGIALVLFLCLYLDAFSVLAEPVRERPINQYGQMIGKVVEVIDGRPAYMTFVGDVLLARDVADRIEEHEIDYPFKGSSELFEVAYVVGNFEAAVPEIHQPSLTGELRFSVDRSHLESLVNARFTHLSLANNHSLDFKEEGLAGAKTELELRGISALGQPNEVSSSSLAYLDLAGIPIALLTLNAVGGYPEESQWKPELTKAQFGSQFQIVYIHWGEEYQTTSSKAQQALAHSLIDAGVDLIIGHHPHVVQEIEKYKDGIIIYSLGNFVFDQYFDEEVQTGLSAKLAFEEGTASIELIPVTSLNSPAQPQIMGTKERLIFLEKLAKRSSPELAEAILAGHISLQYGHK